MEIYALTPLGKSMSHSTRNPLTSEWRIIHHLALAGHATKEQLADYCALGRGEVSAAIVKLRGKGVIVEETGVRV